MTIQRTNWLTSEFPGVTHRGYFLVQGPLQGSPPYIEIGKLTSVQVKAPLIEIGTPVLSMTFRHLQKPF